MVRRFLLLALVLALWSPCAPAQSSGSGSAARLKPEPFLGLSFAAVPPLLYEHLPKLPRNAGLVVERVKADSPAHQAGLRTHDILISYNGTAITTRAQLAGLVRAGKDDSKAPLLLLRAGKEVTLDVSLTQACKLADRAPNPRGSAKKGRPPAINCEATTLANGRLEVTFEFYPEGKTKLQRVKYAGSLDEIARQVSNLPPPVQDLAKVALDRLRSRKYR